jgi:hypothetical protein
LCGAGEEVALAAQLLEEKQVSLENGALSSVGCSLFNAGTALMGFKLRTSIVMPNALENAASELEAAGEYAEMTVFVDAAHSLKSASASFIHASAKSATVYETGKGCSAQAGLQREISEVSVAKSFEAALRGAESAAGTAAYKLQAGNNAAFVGVNTPESEVFDEAFEGLQTAAAGLAVAATALKEFEAQGRPCPDAD